MTQLHPSADHSVARPLVVTGEEDLLDDVLRLCAAAGVEPQVATEVARLRAAWAAAPLVIVGDDVTASLARGGLPRRDDVVVVSSDLDDAGIWRRAFAIGATHVAVLPDGEAQVIEALASAGRSTPGGVVVAVTGARGGAGATCTAVALALAGARAGARVLLVDGDPLGGGIDLALGAEMAPGLRWPQLAGRVRDADADVLGALLPTAHDVALLSWDRVLGEESSPGSPPAPATPGVDPDVLAAVLDAGVRSHELVVVDVPRRIDESAAAALQVAHTALLVVPGELRAVAAAGRVVATLRPLCPDVRLVVRGPSPCGLSAAEIAESLLLPLAAELAAEPGLAAGLERGDPPGRRPKGPLGSFADRFLAELLIRPSGLAA